MTVLLLSRRHSRPATCDICGEFRSRRSVARVLVIVDDNKRLDIEICRPCMLEGADCATGRTRPRRRGRAR